MCYKTARKINFLVKTVKFSTQVGFGTSLPKTTKIGGGLG